jgi:chemotaxis protein MotB
LSRRKRGGHGGHHGGAWKVAYADFVTAMMALFLVLWLTGLIPKGTKAGLAAYFKDPTMFQKGTGVLPGHDNAIDLNMNPQETIVQPIDEANPPASTESVEADIQQALNSGALWPYRDKIKLNETPEGVEVSVVEKAHDVLFGLGSANPASQTTAILKAIAKQLKTVSNHVMIGGHTDANPLTRKDGYTNWELSTDRANKARAMLESFGLDPRRVAAVRGFAATHPINGQDPFAAENRRISVVVLKN